MKTVIIQGEKLTIDEAYNTPYIKKNCGHHAFLNACRDYGYQETVEYMQRKYCTIYKSQTIIAIINYISKETGTSKQALRAVYERTDRISRARQAQDALIYVLKNHCGITLKDLTEIFTYSTPKILNIQRRTENDKGVKKLTEKTAWHFPELKFTTRRDPKNRHLTNA